VSPADPAPFARIEFWLDCLEAHIHMLTTRQHLKENRTEPKHNECRFGFAPIVPRRARHATRIPPLAPAEGRLDIRPVWIHRLELVLASLAPT
jgi:hypothetical protein